MITLFWDCEEMVLMDAMPTGETVNSDAYIRTHTELGSVSNDFGLARIQGKSCFSKAAHKFWGRLGRSSQNLFGQCTLQPRSTAVLFQLIWSPEGCNSQYEVWNWWVCDECSDKLATWAGQGTEPTRHVYTSPLLRKTLWKDREWTETDTFHNV